MAETPSRSVTISAIAAEAGVSAPTVSRVLNGRGDVAPETRERIENLLRLRGYRRRGSRGDGQRRGERIGLIDLVFNDLDSPWAVEIIRGVEDAAHGMDSGIAVSAIHRQASSTRKWLQNVRSRASDGAVLVTTDLDSELRSELEELHIPVVVIDPVGLSDLTVPTIGCTNWQADSAPRRTSSSSATGGSASWPDAPNCGAAAPASTATGPAWKQRESRWTPS